MDLIFMNEKRGDIGVLQNYSLDMAFGADENNFECQVQAANHCCKKDYMLYMEGTEYGGIVDGIGVDTESNAVTYSGRTWHGILASKVIMPLMEGEQTTKPTAKLPDGYTELAYIASSGTQYIDTGFKPNQDTKAEIQFQFDKAPTSYAAVLGTRNAALVQYWFFYDPSNKAYIQRYGSNSKKPEVKCDITKKATAIMDKNVFTVDGNVVSDNADTFAINNSMFLFALNDGYEGTVRYHSAFKLYSCKIYDNDVLVRDYVPCINADGTPGLFDLIDRRFYGNSGTGVFVAGEVIEKPEEPEEPENETAFDVDIITQNSEGRSFVDRYLVLSGDAHECIKYILHRCGLSTLFSVPEDASGININAYQFDRFTDAYKGLKKMLASVNQLLHFSFDGGMVILSAIPKHDYSKDEEFDSDLVGFEMARQENKVNHLICLGGGELENRLVKHLYVDADGNISETQTFFGLEEIAEIYDYANAESEEELLKDGREHLKELHDTDSLKIDFEAKDDLYNVGDIVGAIDNITGISVAAEIVKKIITIKDGMATISYEVGD